MKIKVLAVAPYPGLAELIGNLSVHFPKLDMTIVQADMEESLHMLKKYEHENFDYIISRGGTAKLIEKHTSIPVTEIQVSGYDILRILTLLKGYQSKIEMIGFSNIIHSFEAISNLINMEISYQIIDHENEVERAIKNAQEKGVQVIVGDTITVRLAKNLGMQGVLITSGRESVEEAFQVILKMHRHLHAIESKNRYYEQIFNNQQDGLVIVNQNGRIVNANQYFMDLFKLSELDSNRSLFELFPYFKRFIQSIDKSREFNIEINLYGKRYNVSSSRLEAENSGEVSYFIKFSLSEEQKHGFFIRYPHDMIGNFPQLIISNPDFDKKIAGAKQLMEQRKPLFIFGEKGSGKSLFINLLQSSYHDLHDSLIEIVINSVNEFNMEAFMQKLEGEAANTIIHIIGFDKIPRKQQKEFYDRLNGIRAQLMISFNETLDDSIAMQSKFDPHLLQIAKQDPIFIPPLRDRFEELEEIIRGFIVHFNEKFGKQIVGIQPQALKKLQQHPWYGNFFELREVVGELVKLAEGEYIDEKSVNSLSIVGERTDMLEKNVKPQEDSIDFSKTLEEIERQIIQKVFEEEEMNQSKTAKRLGISRSTLWRKLKLEENPSFHMES